MEEAKQHHEEEIKTHDEAIEELEEQLQWHKEKKRRHEKKLEEKKDLLDDNWLQLLCTHSMKNCTCVWLHEKLYMCLGWMQPFLLIM